MNQVINFILSLLFGVFLSVVHLILFGVFAVTVVGKPFGDSLFELSKFFIWSADKWLTRDREMEDSGVLTVFAVLYLPIGLILALAVLTFGVLSFCTIAGYTFGYKYIKILPFVVWPLGTKCVSEEYVG